MNLDERSTSSVPGRSDGSTGAHWLPVLPPAPRRRPVLSWLLGLAGVVVAGIVVGLVGYQLSRPTGVAAESDEGWGEFGAWLAGFAVGTLALVVGWCVLLVVYVRVYVAAGSRLRVVGASAGMILAIALGAGVLVALAAAVGQGLSGSGGGMAALGALWGAELAAAATPPAMVDRYRGRGRGR